ncbi:unnamed protein product [Moneuplotes crassus]|uniref:Aquaporin n=2 Tax=Euplotes crassus TaxID=5936 RepID=A0AAD1XUS9_EUPCR|nr:unnamed protein product [Moneuplotes crassus]
MKKEGNSFAKVFCSSFLILIFEFVGTVVLTVFQRMTNEVIFLFAFWWILALSYNITGGHFNPAVTITFMLRKDKGKFNWPLGFAYIIVQFIGAFCGALLAFMWTQEGGNIVISDIKYTFQAILSEIFASFLFIFMFLVQTEEATRFSQDKAIWSLIVAATYGTCLEFNEKVSGSLNPAFGLGVHLTMLMDHGHHFLKYSWIFIVFPFVGGIIALIVHEFVYKKTQELIQEEDEEDEKQESIL